MDSEFLDIPQQQIPPIDERIILVTMYVDVVD
jgi:hypothetical protein